MSFANRNLTGILDFTTDEIRYMIRKARLIKTALVNKDIGSYRLAGGKDLLAASLFYENSTRTRSSFDVAAKRLGMEVTGFTGVDGTSVKKGESLRHTLDMYESYLCDCVILRHPLDGSARFAAEHLGVPVFNAGDGKHEHPTQTLLDLFTIWEHLGRLDDFDMGIAGDLKYGRTAHSLVMALSQFNGVRLHLFSHPSLALPDDFVEMAKDAGMEVTVYESLREISPVVDILYQTRIQKERMPDLSEFAKAKAISEFKLSHMELTGDSFGLMHPLPIDRAAPSISASLDTHSKSLYKIQAGNGVPTRLAELALSLGLMGEDFEGESFKAVVEDEQFLEPLDIQKKAIRHDVSIRPIRNNGVVIDHLLPYAEDLLMHVLRVREREDIYRAATVKSQRDPGKVKGMLMIENRKLTNAELKAVASVSPGATVNNIVGGEVINKTRLRLPHIISDVPRMVCSNQGCISRPEYQESISPRMIRAGYRRVKCDYCGHIMNVSRIIS